MRAGSDFLGALGCSDGKLDLALLDFCHLGLPADQASDRGAARWRTLTAMPTAFRGSR
jgi:hypothetical protein